MPKQLVFALLLAALPLSVSASDAPIGWRDARKAPPSDLLQRSVVQLAHAFKTKDLWIVPLDKGYALFEAKFALPLAEIAAGVCGGKRIELQYDWDGRGAARAKTIDVSDIYVAVGPMVVPGQPRDDKETEARCARHTSFGPTTFTADSERDAIAAADYLAEAKALAGANALSLTLTCPGDEKECSIAHQVLATLDLEKVQQVRRCADEWFDESPGTGCEMAMLVSDIRGPDFWFVKITERSDKMAVTMKPGHVMRPH
jgi:hypothetical protein